MNAAANRGAAFRHEKAAFIQHAAHARIYQIQLEFLAAAAPLPHLPHAKLVVIS